MRLIAGSRVFGLSCRIEFSAPQLCCYGVRLHVAHSLVFTFIAFSGTSLTFAEDPNNLSNQFLIEAPKKENEYFLFAERLQGSVSTTFSIFDPTGKMENRMRSRKEIKQNGQCASFLSQSYEGELTEVDDKNTSGALYVVNPRYTFELKRGSSKQDWLLEALDLHGAGKDTLFEGDPIREMLFSWTGLMYDVYGRRISALMQEKTFRVTRAASLNRNGRDLVQVKFICPHPISKNTRNYFVQGGSLLLDPDRYWSIQEADLETQSIDGAGTEKMVFEFKDGSDHYPIVTRMIRNGKSPLGNTSEAIFEFDFHEVTKLPPDKEFALSAFGLPEPMGVEPLPPSRTWLWLLAAAFAAAVLALLFAWLKRRRSMASQVKTQVVTRSR
jgi:hypothetical protein